MKKRINPFSNFQYFNDIRFFEMPYQVYGNYARKIMLEKYKKLSNDSNRPQHMRLRKW